jgi:orotidine-5'-phosphate decarboxylase
MTKAELIGSAEDVARARLIVALDVSSSAEAFEIVAALRGRVGMFKVGLQLFSSAGPAVVRELVQRGERVFLDLKFHDIPNTVAAAGVEATRLGVSMFNVHAAGGFEMMSRTRDEVAAAAAREGIPKPHLIAVTVLTSSNELTLKQVGVESSVEDQVKRLALLTAEAGLDGVVASPLEVKLVNSAVERPNFLLVTPGVRPVKSSADDQKRVLTPREAIAAGADFLVVGRPITAAANMEAAAEDIVLEMAEGIRDLK